MHCPSTQPCFIVLLNICMLCSLKDLPGGPGGDHEGRATAAEKFPPPLHQRVSLIMRIIFLLITE